ncbi:MAG: hypothetical protein B6242_13690, partial [Anaerolineaceae bacterium 4572_78]
SHRKEKRKAFEQLWQLPYWDFPRKLQRVLGGLLNYWFPKEGGKMEEGLTIEYFIELGKQAEERFLNSIPIEKRLASIPIEVMLSQYNPKEVLTVYAPKDVLTMYNPREIIENYPTQTLLAEISAKERLTGISAEELMQHLSADVIESLQKALAESKNQE